MAISPVASTNASVTATQAVRPAPEATQVRQAQNNDNRQSEDAVRAAQTAPQKPTVNTNGQTVGTLVNVTA